MTVPTWRQGAGDPDPVHELVVAGGHGVAIHLGQDAVAGDLLDLPHPAAVQGFAIGLLEALADGVGGGALRQGGVLQQPVLVHGGVMDAGHLEDPLGEGAGLVKDHIVGLGEDLQVVGPLHQHPVLAGPPPMPAKKDREWRSPGRRDS